MHQMFHRPELIEALKKHVLPVLHGRGFTGTFPYFRRFTDQGIDLLAFGFDKWDTGFVVEIAVCPRDGTTAHWGEKFDAKNVTTHHVRFRLRLGSTVEESDHWFRYGKKTLLSLFSRHDRFEVAALEVLPFLESQAESWWKHEKARAQHPPAASATCA